MKTIKVDVTRFYTLRIPVRVVAPRKLYVVNHDYWRAYKSGMDNVRSELTFNDAVNRIMLKEMEKMERYFKYAIGYVFAAGMLFEALAYLVSLHG